MTARVSTLPTVPASPSTASAGARVALAPQRRAQARHQARLATRWTI